MRGSPVLEEAQGLCKQSTRQGHAALPLTGLGLPGQDTEQTSGPRHEQQGLNQQKSC